MTPTARSMTLPLTANSRNSLSIDMLIAPRLRYRNVRSPKTPFRPRLRPLSPVRMRTTCSTAVTKILPSPILPVRAALTIASIARSTIAVGDDHLDLDLRQEIDDVFGAAIELGMALLAAEALDLGDGEAGDADLRQRLAHLVELERLDDRFDFFHARPPCCAGARRDASLHDARAVRAALSASGAPTLSHSFHADVIG